jgi:hypothetical protein
VKYVLWEIAIVMTIYLIFTISVVTSMHKASFVHKLHSKGEAICTASMKNSILFPELQTMWTPKCYCLASISKELNYCQSSFHRLTLFHDQLDKNFLITKYSLCHPNCITSFSQYISFTMALLPYESNPPCKPPNRFVTRGNHTVMFMTR